MHETGRFTQSKVKVLILRRGDYFVAQCLDFDIAAQGRTWEQMLEAFTRTFIGHILLAIEHGDQPFEKLNRAPDFYQDKWSRAKQTADRFGRMEFTIKLELPESMRSGTIRVPGEAELLIC